MFDLIIVGAGPAGIYSSYLASMHNLNAKIIEASNEFGGQMLLFKDKPVYDMPGQINVTGKNVLNSLKLQLSKTNNDINFNEKVLKIEGAFPEFKIITDKNEYKSKCIIFASGGGLFQPIRLGIENEEKYTNINYMVDNYKKYYNKDLVIFGGGDTAIDWAHFLFKKAKSINLIHRRNQFRAQESLLEELKKKISILTPFKFFSLNKTKYKTEVEIINIKTKEIKMIKCDEILVFFGQKKIIDGNLDFKVDMDRNYIKVKSTMATTQKGIFAIGNVALYNGKVNMLATALGESATAIGGVVELIFPGKKMTYLTK